MARETPDWSLYRTFLAVMRDRTLSAAARTLGTTQPTVGRQIEALETALGTALFSRAPSGLTPNQAAHDLLPHAEAMAEAAAALERAASGEAGEGRGVVRIAASEYVGCEVLPPILAAFRFSHPRIELELALSSRIADLLRRDADIAVRMLRPTQQNLVARKIGTMRLGLYAHRRYVERFGLPRNMEELHRHGTIGFDRDPHAFRSVTGAKEALPRTFFNFRCDSTAAQLAAMRAGLGIAGCQVPAARREPDLVPVLEGRFGFKLDMWLVMHRDARSTRRIRLLFDHLAAGLTAYVKSDRD
jgi:DNA-binding transcriptional LysR family regulator